MTEHTPTPWESNVSGDGSHTISSPGVDVIIASVWPFMRAHGELPAEANADFIVKAANAHADLVDALEHAQAAIDYLVRGADVVSSDKVAGAVDHIKRALKAIEA